MTLFTSLHNTLTSFIKRQEEYNQAYGLFEGTYIRPFSQPVPLPIDPRISLSPELEYLYTHYEMVDEKAAGTLKMKSAAVLIGDGIVLFFPAPEHLHRQQYGYRWIGSPEMLEESPDWPASHVVIANYNDDPIIVDIAASGSPVYAAFEGGSPHQIAASLADFFQALTILIDGAYELQGEITDEDTDEVKPDYLHHIEPQLEPLLGPSFMHNLLIYLSLRSD